MEKTNTDSRIEVTHFENRQMSLVAVKGVGVVGAIGFVPEYAVSGQWISYFAFTHYGESRCYARQSDALQDVVSRAELIANDLNKPAPNVRSTFDLEFWRDLNTTLAQMGQPAAAYGELMVIRSQFRSSPADVATIARVLVVTRRQEKVTSSEMIYADFPYEGHVQAGVSFVFNKPAVLHLYALVDDSGVGRVHLLSITPSEFAWTEYILRAFITNHQAELRAFLLKANGL